MRAAQVLLILAATGFASCAGTPQPPPLDGEAVIAIAREALAESSGGWTDDGARYEAVHNENGWEVHASRIVHQTGNTIVGVSASVLLDENGAVTGFIPAR